jgi:hypothetical protein
VSNRNWQSRHNATINGRCTDCVIYQAKSVSEENSELVFWHKWSHLLPLTIDSILSLDYMKTMGTCDQMQQALYVRLKECYDEIVHDDDDAALQSFNCCPCSCYTIVFWIYF